LWQKGEQSGNVQHVRKVFVDCDRDTLLLQVEQVGPACHEGYPSCFYRQAEGPDWTVVDQRLADPSQIYGRSDGERPAQENGA
jgi:phosphoribosyl-AMP cyclohydrolase